MTTILQFEDISEEGVCFYNPRNRTYQCFLREPLTYKWTEFIYEFYICQTCTFNSVEANRHWTKNLILESQVCTTASYDEWRYMESDEEFLAYLENKAEELDCSDCFDLFGVGYEVGGISYYYNRPDEYCRKLYPPNAPKHGVYREYRMR